MSEAVESNVPSVYVSDLEKLAERVRKVTGEENVEVSFEFIIASLFPTSWKNIQGALTNQYTLGYIQGRKDEQEERKKQIQSRNESDCYCE
jgi:hypothetical protein